MSNVNRLQSLPPERDFESWKGRIQAFDEAAQGRRLAFEAKLDEMYAEREVCRKLASDHAGAVNLVYNAETNQYHRIASEIKRPELAPPPAPPPSPEPIEPPRFAASGRSETSWGRRALDAMHWALAIPIGGFIGYGLTTLTGLPWQRYPGYLVAGVIVGVSAVVGIKLFFDKLWKQVGRQYAMQRPYAALMVAATFVTVLFVGIEAWLGGMALVRYSLNTSYNAADALKPSMAFPLAIAISSATLLISAITGWIAGERSLDDRDEAIRDFEAQTKRHAELQLKRDNDYAQELRRWEATQARAEASHAEHLERIEREAEVMERYRNQPDYQALLKYIGRISALNVEISDAESQIQDNRIARGHGQISIH